jgi:hypothetical protein
MDDNSNRITKKVMPLSTHMHVYPAVLRESKSVEGLHWAQTGNYPRCMHTNIELNLVLYACTHTPTPRTCS